MGCSPGALTTKIHALVDSNGRPLCFELTPGPTHDSQAADTLLAALSPGSFAFADKAYDAAWIRELIEAQEAAANIPDRSNRMCDRRYSPPLYCERNHVERIFNRLKHCRRIATRLEKLAANYLAMIKLAAARIWLTAYESTS